MTVTTMTMMILLTFSYSRSVPAVSRSLRLVDTEVRRVGSVLVGHAGKRYRSIRADIRPE